MTGYHTADILIGKCSVVDPGCLFRIPNPYFSIPDPGPKRSRIRIRSNELKYFYPKKLFLGSRKYDPECFRIFFPSWIPGSNEAPDPGSATLKIREVMSLKMTFASCSSWDIRHGNSETTAEIPAVLRILSRQFTFLSRQFTFLGARRGNLSSRDSQPASQPAPPLPLSPFFIPLMGRSIEGSGSSTHTTLPPLWPPLGLKWWGREEYSHL